MLTPRFTLVVKLSFCRIKKIKTANNGHERESSTENRVQENIQEKPAKATHKNKTMEEKEEGERMNIEEEVEAKLSYKIDLIHAIVGRNLAKDNETGDGIGIDNKLKFVRQQGDEWNC